MIICMLSTNFTQIYPVGTKLIYECDCIDYLIHGNLLIISFIIHVIVAFLADAMCKIELVSVN